MAIVPCVSDGVCGDGRGDDARIFSEALVRGNMQVVNGEVKKIPRPLNAFMLFSNEMRKQLKQQYPGEPNNMISTRLGTAWKSLSEDEKKKYHEMAHKEDLEHRRKYPNYQYCPGQARRMKRVRREQRRHVTQTHRAGGRLLGRSPATAGGSGAAQQHGFGCGGSGSSAGAAAAAGTSGGGGPCQQCCSSSSLSRARSSSSPPLDYASGAVDFPEGSCSFGTLRCSAACCGLASASSHQLHRPGSPQPLSGSAGGCHHESASARHCTGWSSLTAHSMGAVCSGPASGEHGGPGGGFAMAAGEGSMAVLGSYKHASAFSNVHERGTFSRGEAKSTGAGLPPMTHVNWTNEQYPYVQYPQYMYSPDDVQYVDRYNWPCCGAAAPVHMTVDTTVYFPHDPRLAASTCAACCSAATHPGCHGDVMLQQHPCCGYVTEGWHVGMEEAPTPPPINVATPVSVHGEEDTDPEPEQPTYTTLGASAPYQPKYAAPQGKNIASKSLDTAELHLS